MNNIKRRFIKITSWPTIFFILLSFILCSCSSKHTQTTETTTVAIQPTNYTLNFTGTIEPLHTMTIDSPVDGTITQQYFDYGENITKGQLLFAVNSPQLMQNYQTALSDYLRAKKDYINSQAQMQGNEILNKMGLISANEYMNDKGSNFDSALAYSQATQKLKSLLQLSANSQLNFTNLSANNLPSVIQALNQPFNNIKIDATVKGVALSPLKNSTDNSASNNADLSVGSSLKSGQSIVAIGDLSGATVTIKVSEIDINNIQVGQKAIITGDGFPNVTLYGQVAHVDQQAIESDSESSPTFLVKIIVPSLSDSERKLIHVGMSANINLQIAQPANIQIPITAVFNQNGQSMVNIVDPITKKIITTPVVTGPTSIDSVTILHGLHTGDQVINNSNVS